MVALRSLEKFDGLTATSILAALVMEEGSPRVGTAAKAPKYEVERREVLDELKVHLHLDALNSDEARTALLAELTRQIYNLSMAGKDVESVLARAGESGRLAPSLYRIEYSPSFQDFINLGTKTNHVVDAILRPDDIQHFPGSDGNPSFSIILKFKPNASSGRSFWLVVYAHRTGRTLITQNAWRLYTDEFEPTANSRPVDFLRAVADKFGMLVEAGSQMGRFIFYSDVHHEIGKTITAYIVKGTRNKAVHHVMSGFDRPTFHRVVIAFAIDLDRYEAALRRRGVRARIPNARRSQRDEIKVFVTNRGDVTDYTIEG